MKKYKLPDVSTAGQARFGRSYLDSEPPLEKTKPSGPFWREYSESEGDLLLFVPRNEISRTINTLTGRYGYSHLAVDCGEVDVPTGRRVMIEATMDFGVHYAFQDEYGKRPFVRLPLRETGVDIKAFCKCVRAKIGEKFDDLEAITLGILDNPARQICSDLATVCLPQEMREKIARFHKRAVLHPLSVARDQIRGTGPRLFMSPNGFAEFLNAPRGRDLEDPNQLAHPRIQKGSDENLLPRLWKLLDTLVTSTWMMVRNLSR